MPKGARDVSVFESRESKNILGKFFPIAERWASIAIIKPLFFSFLLLTAGESLTVFANVDKTFMLPVIMPLF